MIQVGCVMYMRDSLALVVFALTVKCDALVDWQSAGLPPEDGKKSLTSLDEEKKQP